MVDLTHLVCVLIAAAILVSIMGLKISNLLYDNRYLSNALMHIRMKVAEENQPLPTLAVCAKCNQIVRVIDGNTQLNEEHMSKSKVIKKDGPISLSQYGEDILKDIEFYKNIWPDLKQPLIEYLSRYDFKNPYDVHIKSYELVKDVGDMSPISGTYDQLKKVVYKTGHDLDEVFVAMGIVLRDAYLELNPEILD